MKFTVYTNLMVDNPLLINTKIYRDLRGFFSEVYTSKNGYLNKYKFVQDNISSSKKGVIRGLHFQSKYPQTKFITVIKGKIFDVAIDLRNKSKNFGKVFSYNLSDKKNNQLIIPRGFAHGFQCLSDYAIIHYKCDNYYYINDQHGISINDETFKIKWPIKTKIVSSKDKALPIFNKDKKYF